MLLFWTKDSRPCIYCNHLFADIHDYNVDIQHCKPDYQRFLSCLGGRKPADTWHPASALLMRRSSCQASASGRWRSFSFLLSPSGKEAEEERVVWFFSDTFIWRAEEKYSAGQTSVSEKEGGLLFWGSLRPGRTGAERPLLRFTQRRERLWIHKFQTSHLRLLNPLMESLRPSSSSRRTDTHPRESQAFRRRCREPWCQLRRCWEARGPGS